MSGLPMVPSALAWLNVSPPERLNAAVDELQQLVERVEFWLVMNDVWWLRPISSWKLTWLSERINNECSIVESMLPKPTIQMKLVATTASTSDHVTTQTFIDCAGRRHARISTGY